MPYGNLTSIDQESANILNEYFPIVFEIIPDGPLPVFEDRPFLYQTENMSITEKGAEKTIAALNPVRAKAWICSTPNSQKNLR